MSVYFKEVEPFEIEGKLYSFKRLKVREPQKLITLVKNVYLLALADMQTYADRFPAFGKQLESDFGKYLEIAFSSEYALNYIMDLIQTKLVRLEGDQKIDLSEEEFDNLPPQAAVILLENFYKHPDLLEFKKKLLELSEHPLIKGLLAKNQNS